MDLSELYQTIILDHYKRKLHSGLREPYTAQVQHVNPSCGDELLLRADVEDGIIKDISYEGVGCSISQASTSVMSDLVIGKSVPEALALESDFKAMMQSQGAVEPDEDRFEDAVAFAGVSKFPARVKCALLSWEAMLDAVYRSGATSEEKR